MKYPIVLAASSIHASWRGMTWALIALKKRFIVVDEFSFHHGKSKENFEVIARNSGPGHKLAVQLLTYIDTRTARRTDLVL